MITSHERPRLREDLVAEAIEDQGVRFIDVIDPDTGNGYRFYDVEYSLACAMDGERDLPGLVRWAQEELGIAPSPSELKSVIATLGDLGYLDSGAESSGDLGLAPGLVAGPASTRSSGTDVELGPFRAESVAVAASPVAAIELGAAGASERPLGESLPLGPAGVAAAVLPLPPASLLPKAAPTPPQRAGTVPRAGTDVPGAVESRRPGTAPARPEARPPQVQQRSEPAMRPSEPHVRAEAPVRSSEPKVAQPPIRPSEPKVAQPPIRTSEPRLRASDPSVNLSLPIRPDDVKEAVRASREMRSVDVPTDLMQALESAELGMRQPAPSPLLPATPRPSVESARTSSAVPSSSVLAPIAPISGTPLSMSDPITPQSVPPLVPVPRIEPRPEYPRAGEVRPALAPAPREASGPVVAIPVPQPARRSNVLIVALLVMAIVGVVGFGVWKFVIDKVPAEPAPAPTSVTPVPVETAPPAPPPPAPVTAKLSLSKPAPVAVKMPSLGSLQSIVATGSVVREGDPVAQLLGGKALEQQVIAIKGDLDKRYPADIKRIQTALTVAAGNNAAVARLQAELTNRTNRIAQRTAELKVVEAEIAKLSLLAKVGGKVTTVAKVGARLTAGTEIMTIEQDAYLSGAADLGKPVIGKAGDPIDLRVKDGTGGKCTLETVQGTMVSFRCPLAAGFSDGVEVVLNPQ
jgi:cytoskeletal protein RodZ